MVVRPTVWLCNVALHISYDLQVREQLRDLPDESETLNTSPTETNPCPVNPSPSLTLLRFDILKLSQGATRQGHLFQSGLGAHCFRILCIWSQ